VEAELVLTEKSFQEIAPSGNKNNNIYKANVKTTVCLTGNHSIIQLIQYNTHYN
jgi:hypothetical protein